MTQPMAPPTQDWPIAIADSRGTASSLRRRHFQRPMRRRSSAIRSSNQYAAGGKRRNRSTL